MNKDILNKIIHEESLSVGETHELDEALDKQCEMGLGFAVRRSPVDEPSMAWRSALNAKLAQEAGRTAKPARKPWMLWAGILAPAAACTLAIVLFMQTGGPKPVQPVVQGAPSELEQAVVMIHKSEESETSSGLALPEEDTVFDFSDLGAL